MSLNSQRVKLYPGGTGKVLALSGVTAGTTTSDSSLVLSPGASQNIGAVAMYVSAAVTTTSLVIKTKWQGSNDGTNWYDILQSNGAALVQVPATGTGSLVTTVYWQLFGDDPAIWQYLRGAVVSSGATGGAGDNITIGYNWLRRFWPAQG